jgi:hypothetical protein
MQNRGIFGKKRDKRAGFFNETIEFKGEGVLFNKFHGQRKERSKKNSKKKRNRENIIINNYMHALFVRIIIKMFLRKKNKYSFYSSFLYK